MYKLQFCTSIPHNNVDLSSKAAEEIDSENTENYRFRQPHCRLTSSIQENPANVRTNIILPETRVFSETRVDIVMGSENAYIVDFGISRERVCDFLLLINSNLGPILLRLQVFC